MCQLKQFRLSVLLHFCMTCNLFREGWMVGKLPVRPTFNLKKMRDNLHLLEIPTFTLFSYVKACWKFPFSTFLVHVLLLNIIVYMVSNVAFGCSQKK
ncbi:hypothetical protein I3843_Q046200 [Carya illinoinensis]|uniref:Uncharacterized protein n=1 Tax=Carya illinoinensis TaxID=32201 RepID=A0A922JMN1_CARIL|nr:hypothetical protein I3760_Q008300 [Carya illinoinensis]KAG2707591.1 hypothetical protein I3760_05G154300 [Carya illinoinensis]KAG6670671.1 hypothetical protein I3843_Q046800 [Carya illinoinensis]KAG6670677.1 hypothetical protein I3843_Q046200 [Carya illinoinensis]KAG6713423.1 hypothetical protein I3842_05G151600 [Carya illinoinensis]